MTVAEESVGLDRVDRIGSLLTRKGRGPIMGDPTAKADLVAPFERAAVNDAGSGLIRHGRTAYAWRELVATVLVITHKDLTHRSRKREWQSPKTSSTHAWTSSSRGPSGRCPKTCARSTSTGCTPI